MELLLKRVKTFRLLTFFLHRREGVALHKTALPCTILMVLFSPFSLGSVQ